MCKQIVHSPEQDAPPSPMSPSTWGSPSPLSVVLSRFPSDTNLEMSSPAEHSPEQSDPIETIYSSTQAALEFKSACLDEEKAFIELHEIKLRNVHDIDATISDVERIYVRQYLRRAQHREETAVKLSRHYRDELENLKRELEDEKIKHEMTESTFELEKKKIKADCQQQCNRIREFWRSKLAEGGCRSGDLVRRALQQTQGCH